jgi:hypothetical protein
MATIPQPTLLDKLKVLPNVGVVLAAVFFHLLKRPFSSGPKANTFLKDVAYAAFRKHLSITSPAQEQWTALNPKTESTYIQFAKQKKFDPDTEILESGLKLHWLGSKKAEKVILYC